MIPMQKYSRIVWITTIHVKQMNCFVNLKHPSDVSMLQKTLLVCVIHIVLYIRYSKLFASVRYCILWSWRFVCSCCRFVEEQKNIISFFLLLLLLLLVLFRLVRWCISFVFLKSIEKQNRTVTKRIDGIVLRASVQRMAKIQTQTNKLLWKRAHRTKKKTH